MWPLSRFPALRGISASLHVIFEPLDFIARLATLNPKPGVNFTRFHGVLAQERLGILSILLKAIFVPLMVS